MASYQENEPFDMDQLPFDMEDDYGFYEDLEEDCLPQPSSDEDTMSHSYGRIEDEFTESLQSSPPILSTDIVEQIVEDGLPWAMQEMKWDRLFSSSRDGNNFGTFMRKTRGHAQTIIVAKSSNGKIVGAYATEPWSGKKPSNNTNSKHGFIFSALPAKRGAMSPLAHPSSHSSFGSYIPGLEDLATSPTSAFDFDFETKSSKSSKGRGAQVDISKSHTKAGLTQVCQLSNKLISLGDGENLNLSIEGCFSRGSTFNQQADREDFKVVEFEVYGFSDS